MQDSSFFIELTVADHEQEGFVGLARWRIRDAEEGRRLLAAADAACPAGAEGDPKTDAYTFILDLRGPGDTLEDSGEKSLPLQLAMRLAPDVVRSWLEGRPDPDRVCHRWSPILQGLPDIGEAAHIF